MASALIRRDRNVIPRWRSARATLELGETKALQHEKNNFTTIKAETHAAKYLQRLREEFEGHKSLSFAIDLAAAAFAWDEFPIAAEASALILTEPDAPKSARELAMAIIGEQSQGVVRVYTGEPSYNSKIRSLKQLIRANGRDAFSWMDLGRIQATLGMRTKAARSVETALGLAPESRFILRAAARFFVHVGDLHRSLRIVQGRGGFASDPWLAAAEIAIANAAKLPSASAKIGRAMLSSGDFSAFETSELAAALATLDVTTGAHKRAKKFLRTAIQDPTENSLAQARWISENQVGLGDVDLSAAVFNTHVSRPFEAKAFAHYALMQWRESAENAEKWLQDQPFSVRPVLLAAHVRGTILGDYGKAMSLVERGQIANSDDPHLLNLMAFYFGSLGKVDKANEFLGKVKLEGAELNVQVVKRGNLGLVEYRSGRPALGRIYYGMAEQMAADHGHRELQALALMYWAREESSFNSESAAALLERAQRLIEGLQDQVALEAQFKRILRHLKRHHS